MLSHGKENSPEEVDALKILRDGFLPEIQEQDLLSNWIPLFGNPQTWNEATSRWIATVSKNASQRVKIMRGLEHVGFVPPLFGQWPTERVVNAKDTISELVSTAELMSSRIPSSGVTCMREGLKQQLGRTMESDLVRGSVEELRDEWRKLFVRYGLSVQAQAVSAPSATSTSTTGTMDDNFVDEEF